jgi:hypothetical protein
MRGDSQSPRFLFGKIVVSDIIWQVNHDLEEYIYA